MQCAADRRAGRITVRLSVGSVTALASVVGATLMIDVGTPGIPVGIVSAAAVCLLIGATNGWLIAYLGVNPFVATLGTMTVVRGLIYVATSASPRFGVPYSFTTLGLGRLFGVPNPAILFLTVAALARFCSPSNAFWPLRLRRRRQFRRLDPDGCQRRARALRGLRSRVPLRGDIGRHPHRPNGECDAAGGARIRAHRHRRGDCRRRPAGLEDGTRQFGFTYDLVDGNSGDVATELANLQNFLAQKKDLILLTPSGDGIIPGIKLVNEAHVPLIEVNNKAGFGRSEVNVLTYVGADDLEFGRLQGKLLDQAFGGKKAKVA